MSDRFDEHVDVLIVGAGLSGVGAACRLRQRCPTKSFAILEARGAMGGTWDLFRFPGVRSDSDMYTLAYPFRPWRGTQAIVDGGSILRYIRETATEYGVEEHIRYHHRVVSAEWSSADGRWHVEAERVDTGESVRLSAAFLYSCTGYYRYEAGYTPPFPGAERFTGQIVHPQLWSDEVDYAGKRVVVIGSGATAVTLVPAMAERAAHVTMLQRSPSYVLSIPALDPIAGILERVLPERLAARAVREKNIWVALAIYGLSRRWPAAMKRLIRKLIERQLPGGFDVDTHFTPSYDPWDQRMCLVPDNDLFEAIRAGRVSMATDRIETFTERGIVLASGRELEADVIVTATGLSMVPLGDIALSVDGGAVELPQTLVYRGMMLTGVPNLAIAFGYINQSWTLGADLTCEYVCRLLNHMDAHGYDVCTPRDDGEPVPTLPFAELSSGYILRSIDRFPRQRSGDPWRRVQHYPRDRRSVRRAPLDDPALAFSRASGAKSRPSAAVTLRRRLRRARSRTSRIATTKALAPAASATTAASRRSQTRRSSRRHLQRVRRGDDPASELHLEKQPPHAGLGQQHADGQLPGRRGLAAHPARGDAGERAAVGRVRGADVAVEVVERSLVEEDRVSQRAEPRDERDLGAARVGDQDVDELSLDRMQGRMRLHVDVVAAYHQVRLIGRQRLGPVGARHGDRLEQLEVRLPTGEVRVDVDEHAVRPGGGERDRLSQHSAGPDRRMLVDDVGEVVADDDQVNARVRSRSGAVLGERLARRLLHGE